MNSSSALSQFFSGLRLALLLCAAAAFTPVRASTPTVLRGGATLSEGSPIVSADHRWLYLVSDGAKGSLVTVIDPASHRSLLTAEFAFSVVDVDFDARANRHMVVGMNGTVCRFSLQSYLSPACAKERRNPNGVAGGLRSMSPSGKYVLYGGMEEAFLYHRPTQTLARTISSSNLGGELLSPGRWIGDDRVPLWGVARDYVLELAGSPAIRSVALGSMRPEGWINRYTGRQEDRLLFTSVVSSAVTTAAGTYKALKSGLVLDTPAGQRIEVLPFAERSEKVRLAIEYYGGRANSENGFDRVAAFNGGAVFSSDRMLSMVDAQGRVRSTLALSGIADASAYKGRLAVVTDAALFLLDGELKVVCQRALPKAQQSTNRSNQHAGTPIVAGQGLLGIVTNGLLPFSFDETCNVKPLGDWRPQPHSVIASVTVESGAARAVLDYSFSSEAILVDTQANTRLGVIPNDFVRRKATASPAWWGQGSYARMTLSKGVQVDLMPTMPVCKKGFFSSGADCSTYGFLGDKDMVTLLAGQGTIQRATAMAVDGRAQRLYVHTGDAGQPVVEHDLSAHRAQRTLGPGRPIALPGVPGVKQLAAFDSGPFSFCGVDLMGDGFCLPRQRETNLLKVIHTTGSATVVDSRGRFAAESLAGIANFSIASDNRVIPMASFWDVFYRPDLIQAQLQGLAAAEQDGQGSMEAALTKPPPTARVALLADSGAPRVSVRMTLASEGGGVGEVLVFHNGKLVKSDGFYKDAPGSALVAVNTTQATSRAAVAAGLGKLLGAGEATSTPGAPAPLRDSVVVRQSRPKPLNSAGEYQETFELDVIPGEDNDITVMARNADNTLLGQGQTVRFSSTRPKVEPHLWVLSVGIGSFQDAGVPALASPRKDALDFACSYGGRAALQAVGVRCDQPGYASSLFEPARIHVLPPLLDQQATRAAILARLDEVAAKAGPADTFIWFVSSHGTMDANSVYGIVPHDARCSGANCEAADGLVSSNDILDKSKAIKAMRQLLVLDTCQAGGLDAKMSGLYDVRMSGLAKNMGLHLYAAATATESALDGPDASKNSVFTATLLEGLAGQAPRDDAGRIGIVPLGRYVKDQTPLAARKTYGDKVVQTPLIQHFGKDAPLTQPAAGR